MTLELLFHEKRKWRSLKSVLRQLWKAQPLYDQGPHCCSFSRSHTAWSPYPNHFFMPGTNTLVLDFIGKCHHWQKSLLIKNYKFQSLKDSIGKKKSPFFFSSKIACMLLSYCKQTSSSISLYIFFQNQKEKHITFGNFVFLKIICISRSCP